MNRKLLSAMVGIALLIPVVSIAMDESEIAESLARMKERQRQEIANSIKPFPKEYNKQLPYIQPFLVNVKVNGYTFRLMFDTGADHTALQAIACDRVGLKINSPLYQEKVGVVNGSSNVLAFVASSIEVQGIKRGPFKVNITNDEDGTDGLLGRDFLEGLGGVVMAPNGQILFLTKEKLQEK